MHIHDHQTGSNGDPRDSRSLHYMGPPKYESQYLQVLKSVGRVLEPYDSDKMITSYGFGANIAPPQKVISHCFPLTFDESSADVPGIDGVIDVYRSTLKRVQLYGPTVWRTVFVFFLVLSEFAWVLEFVFWKECPCFGFCCGSCCFLSLFVCLSF